MPYFMGDDQLPASRKHRALMERVIDADPNGFAAIGLWLMAGTDCQAEGSDGHVSRASLMRLVLDNDMRNLWADLLVSVGLWHRPGHDCPRCESVEPGGHLFHDWFDMKYDKGSQVRVKRAKSKELKDPNLIGSVWARDCVDPTSNPGVGLCRYCSVEMKRADRKSHKRWHLDHVDPAKVAGVRNVVLACHTCNQSKGNRTPTEAGMSLLPAPRAELIEDDSPSRRPVQTVSPEKSAAVTVSTTVNAAGIDDQSHRGAAAGDHSPDHFVPSHDRSPDSKPIAAVPARATRTGAGQAGSGRGQGVGRGAGEGGPTTSDRESPRKRRRRRSRGRSTSQPIRPSPPGAAESTSQSLDAGPAPKVDVPGRFGSPFHGWSGPPAPDVDEMVCPEHGEHEPCWRCKSSAGDFH